MSSMRLPWPPTINTYWRSTAGKSRNGQSFVNVYLSKRGKEYRLEMMGLLGVRRDPITGPVELEIVLHPPDNRQRDIDNVLKPLLDALAHSRVIKNDDQVVRLIVEKREPTKGGVVWCDVRPVLEKQPALI